MVLAPCHAPTDLPMGNRVWGRVFYPTGVGLQFGYEADRSWWSALADPARDIGEAILARVPNTVDLYWVDFSAYSIWPPLQE
jgi:hypothetical protein